jgi:integrase/recombinase XerD
MYDFDSYLIGLGRSKVTREKYAAATESFAKYLKSHGWWPLQRAPRSALRDFLTHLAVERGLSHATVRQHLAGVRKWLDWLRGRPEGANVPEFVKAAAPQKSKMLPKALSAEQVAAYIRLAAAADQPYRTALLALPFCGLRVSEYVSLRLGDLADRHRSTDGSPLLTIRVVGKGNKERVVPVFSNASRLLLSYIHGWRTAYSQQRTDDRRVEWAKRWLFPAPSASRYHHISRDSLEAMVAQMRPSVGVPTLKPHMLRSTYLTALLTCGIPMHEAARYAGHSNVQILFDHYAGLHIAGAPDIFGEIARLT